MSLIQSNSEQDKENKLSPGMISSNKENNCGICMIPLKKKYGLKKIIHKCDSEKCEWKHEFHINCINKWINMCVNTGQGTYPKCPTCNNFYIPIDKIPENLRSKAETLWYRDFSGQNQVIEEEEEEEEEEYVDDEEEEEEEYVDDEEYKRAHFRLNELISQHTENRNYPFLGIVICVNGEIIKKCLNSYLNLKITNTLGDLKNIILNDNVNISKNIGLLNPVKLKLQYWLGSSYPSFRVKNVHYCIPSYLKRFAQLKSDYNLNIDDILLSDIYLEYQYKAGKIINSDPRLINREETPLAYENLEKVYIQQKLHWNSPTGPDDYGHFDRAFSNEENDYIPRDYRAYSYDKHSTINSLAWITLDLAVEDL
jgi:hypothetical protein